MNFHTYQDIILQQEGSLAVLTINRPQVLNALRTQTKQEVANALDIIESSAEIRGLLITGSGKAFISGSDISEIGINRPGRETAEMSAQMHTLLGRLARLKKPTMAVINGYALGGGLELALACDLRVCCPNVKMGLPEIDLGVLPCYGGTQRLPRVVGAGLAKELLFTGRMVESDEAYRIGLVNRIFPRETLLEDAAAWMCEITNRSITALQYAKTCVDEGLELSLQDGLAMESRVAGILVETPEAKANVMAFLEKRKKRQDKKTVQNTTKE